jgi:signal transduction histidine kinase
MPSLNNISLPIDVIPPYYRRWWFISAVVLLALILSWLLVNYRIRQLKRTQAAQKAFSQQLIASQETERRRIAGELHDSLGQRLIVINNLVLFLLRPKGKGNTEEDKRQILEEISAEATAAMDETRAISYDLRPFQLDRLGLSRAIQGLARTATRASGIEFTTNLGGIDSIFPDELRINFFRIVQEAVNNIMKHSAATSASIVAEVSESILTLSVGDNGKGLPSEPRPVNTGPGGFGLTGIQERANLLNGKLRIRSTAGGGTLLTIIFPLEKRLQNV